MVGESRKAASSIASAPKTGTRNVTAKNALGCLALLVAVPIASLVTIFYVASLSTKEWANARPPRMSETKWAEKQNLCEAADLSAKICATTSDRDIQRMVHERAEGERQKLCTDASRVVAIREAQSSVQEQLRAPATAQFENSSVHASRTACDWTVVGNVDAQNAFGALVRSSYRVKVRPINGDTWVPLEVRIR